MNPSVEAESKRRRLERPQGSIPLIDVGSTWMREHFGVEWRGRFHLSHRLALARPLVFCKICGLHCESVQHLVGLGRRCKGEPKDPSRKRKIMRDGKHPVSGARLEGLVPLPLGTRTDGP